MRVIVVGAKGKVGRSVLRGLVSHMQITEVIALSDEIDPQLTTPETTIQRRQVNLRGDLRDELQFADAVVFLGWPQSGTADGASTNGTPEIVSQLCQSVAMVGVRTFVYVSTAGVYAPAPPGESVDESWPSAGATSSIESLRAADSERIIERFEAAHPLIRVVRLRPGFIVDSPVSKVRWRMLLLRKLVAILKKMRQWPLVPNVAPLSIQCIRVADLVEALCLALTRSVNGIFNVATEPITSELLAASIGARQIRIPPRYFVGLTVLGARLGLAPLPADRIEILLRTPDIDTTRAEQELGWVARHPTTSMIEEWFKCLESTSSVPPKAGIPDTASPVDLRSLYLGSLDFFNQAVHAVHSEQWYDGTDEQGLRVWELVASAARAQYRIAFEVRGYDAERIERELPADPLGIARADGWDLAAERGESTLDRLRSGDAGADTLQLSKRVEEVICETVRLGSSLRRAIGIDEKPTPDLSEFLHRCMASDVR